MGYGVIGNTRDSDSLILGSSPSTPAGCVSDHGAAQAAGRVTFPSGLRQVLLSPECFCAAISRAPSSSGLGRRPLTAVARVRIPSGLQQDHPGSATARSGIFLSSGKALGVRLHSRAVRASAASTRSPAHRAPGRRPIRSTGPDTETAAITSPAGERTGAETEATPASRSATDCAQPRRRTWSRDRSVKPAWARRARGAASSPTYQRGALPASAAATSVCWPELAAKERKATHSVRARKSGA